MQPIGFAIWEDELAFVDRESGWIIETNGASDPKYILETIKFHLCGRRPPRLATRYLETDLAALAHLLQVPIAKIANVFVDSLDDLAHCTGRTIVSRMTTTWTIGDDALDALIIGEQLRYEAPPFYTKVSVPLRRLQADRSFNKPADVEVERFKVTYDHLLLKVLAHFTQDPMLIRLFTDEQYRKVDPLSDLATKLEIDYTQVLPFIVHLMVGEDEAVMRRRFPVQASYVPANYGMVKVLYADKKLPTMRYALSSTLDEYRGRTTALSLYGRHAAWGLAPADAAIHHYFGSKQDLLDVAMVSLANGGCSGLNLTEDGWGRSVISGYTDATNIAEFEAEMTDLVQLANPLIVPLNGRIFTDG